MMDAIAVAQAGSPGPESSLFVVRWEALDRDVRGKADAIHTAPRVVAGRAAPPIRSDWIPTFR